MVETTAEIKWENIVNYYITSPYIPKDSFDSYEHKKNKLILPAMILIGEDKVASNIGKIVFERMDAAIVYLRDEAAQAMAEENRRIAEEKKAETLAKNEQAKESKRIKLIASGQVQPKNYEEYAIKYHSEDGFGIISSPPLGGDKKNYRFSGSIQGAEKDAIGNDIYTMRTIYGSFLFQVNTTRSTEIKSSIRFNSYNQLIGKFISTKKVKLTNGRQVVIPVFEALYIE